MAFRGQEASDQARREALEAEVETLRAQNAELTKHAVSDAPQSSLLPAVLLFAAAVGCGAYAAFAPYVELRMILILAAGFFTTAAATTVVIRRYLLLVPPDRICIVAGRAREVNGLKLGYRVVTTGRTMRLPILEKVEWLYGGAIAFERRLTVEVSDGHVDLLVGARCAVGRRHEELLERAVNQWVGYPVAAQPAAIEEAVVPILRSILKRILIQVSRDDLKKDGDKVEDLVRRDIDEQLWSLGLELKTLSLETT